MAKTNVKTRTPPVHTLTGAIAVRGTAETQLRRSVLATMIFEDSFYEDGEQIYARIKRLSHEVSPQVLADLAVEARSKFNLRHVSLVLARELARHPKAASVPGLVAATIANAIQRADEIAEFVAIYWKEGKQPLSKQVKKGLALAFLKFNEYQLAKYNRDADVRLRDVLFLIHAKPDTKAREKLWKKLAENTLSTPDTWETELSAGKDKKATFERLISENKLGAMALLRNLRNMVEAGVSHKLITGALQTADYSRVLPFRFVAAANHAPSLFADIDAAFLRATAQRPKLPGKTVVVVDVSGSMKYGKVSAKSDLGLMEAACALGAIAREMCEEVVVYATAGIDYRETHKTKQVPSTRGLNLVKQTAVMCDLLGGGGIFLTQAMNHITAEQKTADRTIVITDEQDCARSALSLPPSQAKPLGIGYLINVGTAAYGIGKKNSWETITGFSEHVFDWIRETEQSN